MLNRLTLSVEEIVAVAVGLSGCSYPFWTPTPTKYTVPLTVTSVLTAFGSPIVRYVSQSVLLLLAVKENQRNFSQDKNIKLPQVVILDRRVKP